jgi:iron(II)-dependent oxidoreductase
VGPGHAQPDQPWPQAIAALMKEIGADGINGDTQDGVPARLSHWPPKVGHPLAFEPEGGPSDEALAWNVMTWGQYSFPFHSHGRPLQVAGAAPHGQHQRSLESRQDQRPAVRLLQRRGLGELGKYLGHLERASTPRDAEATRRVATIERAVAPIPGQPGLGAASIPMLRYGVFASRWPRHHQTVWTIVNRNEYDVEGRRSPQKRLPARVSSRSCRR